MYLSTCCVPTEVLNSNMIKVTRAAVSLCVLYGLTHSKTCLFHLRPKFTAKTYNIVDNERQ